MSLYSPAELEGREESDQCPITNSHPSRANRYLAMLEKVAVSDQPQPRMRIENWELVRLPTCHYTALQNQRDVRNLINAQFPILIRAARIAISRCWKRW